MIVNWNSVDLLRVTIKAIRHFTPGLEVVVVDNASSDGSRAWMREFGVGCLRLPANVGHELALDIGFLRVRTEYAVALDVDAFPISRGWLDRLLDPVRACSADVSGVHVRGGFVHPCCLAMRTQRFVDRRHTFLPRRGRPLVDDADQDWADRGWDTGWLISLREPRRHLLDRTAVRGPGDLGSEWAGVVYHNFYSTRLDSKLPLSQVELELGINRSEVFAAWEEAQARFL